MKREQQILKFIGSLKGWEIKFVQDTISLSNSFKRYVEEKREEFNQKEFCDQINIQESDYNKFISGEWNYSLSEIGRLERLWTELQKSKVKVDIITVPNNEKP